MTPPSYGSEWVVLGVVNMGEGLDRPVNIQSEDRNHSQSELLTKNYSWLGPPRWLSGKESACQCRRHRSLGFSPWVRKIPWRREWQPTAVFLPENSMDRAAWRATVHGGHKSQTCLGNLATTKRWVTKWVRENFKDYRNTDAENSSGIN